MTADTFGVEEEFMLVDPARLTPVHEGPAAIAALRGGRGYGDVAAEFLPCQIEHSTRVCSGWDELADELHTFRQALSHWADRHGLLAVGSGTPYRRPQETASPRSARYRRIARDVGALTQEHLLNGLHVHTCISDRKQGVRVMNGLRPWLPLLLAVSANSPFWEGQDTGYRSWRAIQTRRWTTYGVPPFLRDADEYDRLHAQLIDVGATRKGDGLNWAIRFSTHLPTIETRVCDAQLSPAASVSLAALLVTLVRSFDGARVEPEPVPSAVIDAEMWHAARYGLSRGAFDPVSGTHERTGVVLDRLRATIRPVATAPMRAIIDDLLSAASHGRSGADLQRDAGREGAAALASLYRSAMTAAP